MRSRMAKQGLDPASRLLDWYDRNARVLPWRALPGSASDPYRVWLSEIMLQQTTVQAVKAYFEKFTRLWPTVAALAAAPLDDVLKAWAGLGYYARARNLHACARAVVAQHGGRFPETEAELRRLPGIGPYTAGAIAAIAFAGRHAAVDGNVERVISRWRAIETPLPESKPEIRAIAQALVPEMRAGDFAQAMMDLGATLCTPKSPNCLICPWTEDCAGRQRGLQAELPRKRPKAAVPLRRGVRLEENRFYDEPAATCDPKLVDELAAAVERCGMAARRLPSGAGHDGLALVALCPIGMLFVRCRGGISHNPAESILEEDAGLAVVVLLDFLRHFRPSQS